MKNALTWLLALCLALGAPVSARAGDPYVRCRLAGGDGWVTLYDARDGSPLGTAANGVSVSYHHQSDRAGSWAHIRVGDWEGNETLRAWARLSDLAESDAEGRFEQIRLTRACEMTNQTGERVGEMPASACMWLLGQFGQSALAATEGTGLYGFIPADAYAPTGQTGAMTDDPPALGTVTVYAPDGDLYPMTSCSDAQCTGDTLQNGQRVSAVRELDGWTLIRRDLPYAQYGYVGNRFLDPNGDHSLPTLTVRTDGVGERLNLRVMPNREASAIMRFYQGTAVAVLSRAEEWSYVRVGDRTGYMMNEYLVTDATDRRPAAVTTRECTLLKESNWASDENLVCTLPNATPVTVLGVADDLLYVQTQDGQYGYLSLADLMPDGGSGVLTARTNTRSLRLRAQPADDAAVIRSLADGTSVTVLLHGDTWSKVECGNDVGYVMTRYLDHFRAKE